jgi:hypothetical protein
LNIKIRFRERKATRKEKKTLFGWKKEVLSCHSLFNLYRSTFWLNTHEFKNDIESSDIFDFRRWSMTWLCVAARRWYNFNWALTACLPIKESVALSIQLQSSSRRTSRDLQHIITTWVSISFEICRTIKNQATRINI